MSYTFFIVHLSATTCPPISRKIPLGVPVVPDVYKMYAGSFASQLTHSAGFAFLTKSFQSIKFESIVVDGSHYLHRSFGVTHAPSVVFVRLGKVIGKHVGYINPSNLEELMDKFTKSVKTKMGLTEYGDARIIPGEEEKVKNNQ